MTSGFSSIISLWFCSRAMASLRGILGGRGVIVVKRTRFPILHVFRLGGLLLSYSRRETNSDCGQRLESSSISCGEVSRLPPRAAVPGGGSSLSRIIFSRSPVSGLA